MLICKDCGNEWSGLKWERKKRPGQFDYQCKCGGKKKPEEVAGYDVAKPPSLVETVLMERYMGETPVELMFNTDDGKYYTPCRQSYPELERVEERRVLVLPDLHTPFMRKGALEFLTSISDKYCCNEIVCVGDESDWSASSYHESDPDGMSAGDEVVAMAKQLAEVALAFPNMKVCYGNHSEIPKRKIKTAGLPSVVGRPLKEVYLALGVPCEGWEFRDHFDIDGVKYCHGTNRKAKARMLQDGCSVIQGHYHSESYIQWHVNKHQRNFAMQIGALVDDDSYAMSYGKHFAKSIACCGVVLENGELPIIEMMRL